MRIEGRDFRTIWGAADGEAVEVIDQRALPHRFALRRLRTAGDAAGAISDMTVRGAPLIGAAVIYVLMLLPFVRSVGLLEARLNRRAR